jgi:hypothetical protein
VKVVPLSEHDSDYCADDIEIWEVKRIDGSYDSEKVENVLCMKSWGDIPVVEANFFGSNNLKISQSVSGTIGCILWPSSVVLSRFFLFDYFVS